MSNNKFILSLDVSTTNVGLSLWNESGQLVELKHLELKNAAKDKETPSEDRYIYKSDLFEAYLNSFKKRIMEEYDAAISHVFIEAPLSNTPKNINTTAMLLGFNGIACFIIYKIFNIVPKRITVYEARSIFCNEYVKTKVIKKTGEVKRTLSFPKGWKNAEKKEFIRQKVAKLEPQINWFYTRNNTIKDTSYDMSDSYAVGYAGLKQMGIL